MDYQLIDSKTGEVLATAINLWGAKDFETDCGFCGTRTSDFIGIPVGNDGSWVWSTFDGEWGGVAARKTCYGRWWEAWNAKETYVTPEYPSGRKATK